ncbi:uncharacterized protein LOC124637887 [Helicoverpa zea]|uniref:uncharacterized protein LOC124637887 n=1 Tax=Helicoverpa zea TaxID=7113 RepID=UPI001F57EA5C|nr:uncharacterized protein LOC124637887 [Helicoverpa zea]
MGKRKRSRSRSRSDIRRKVKKLERKLEKYKKCAPRSSSSETSDNPEREWSAAEFENTDNFTNPDDVFTLDDEEPLPGPSRLSAPPLPPSMSQATTTTKDTLTINNEELINEGQPVDEPSSLDPEILQILGEDPSNLKEYGEHLHKDLASRWSHIVTNGLNKEIKQELLKKYLTPENCKNLKAPKLNLEVKAALNDFNIKKDSYNQMKQNQLSSALTAIGSALNMILSSKDSSNQQLQQLIQPLSDAARLICDCHYKESVSRRFDITKILNKETKDMVKNSKIDEYLFGSDLADQLKCHKAIAKSGLEMKAVSTARVAFRQTPTTQTQRGALNARGTTRATAGGTRRNPTPRRPAPAPTRDRQYTQNTSNSGTTPRNYSSRARTTTRRRH